MNGPGFQLNISLSVMAASVFRAQLSSTQPLGPDFAVAAWWSQTLPAVVPDSSARVRRAMLASGAVIGWTRKTRADVLASLGLAR
jgi:hypothetical protein